MSVLLAGYYAILDLPPALLTGWSEEVGARTLQRAERMLAGRPCMLQLRAKGASAAVMASVARTVLPAARSAGIPFCVNDRVDVALAVGADAVHLGQDDLPLAEARQLAGARQSGRRLRIGISTHSLAQASQAIGAGADYIGFGPIFATGTKANPDPVVGIEALRRVCAIGPGVPVVAIGGITMDRIADVAAAGAAAAALIAALDTAADPVAAALSINEAFRRARVSGI